MSRKADRSRNIAKKFESNLLSGLLRQKQRHVDKCFSKVDQKDVKKIQAPLPRAPTVPESKYTNAKGAAKHLGISKATFFRRRAAGFFQPSPVTGKYHLDELDREVKGIPAVLLRTTFAEGAAERTLRTLE